MMTQPLRVLLIDDDPDDRALALHELRRVSPDFRIQQVTEAEGLAQALEAGGYDLIITDYYLSWADGLTILRTAKARDPECPVIMFTGSGSEEVVVEAMKAGVDDYVIKSSKQARRLPAAVRSVLEQARQRRAAKEAETRYRSLFDGVPMGLYRLARDGRLLDANPALVEMLGYPDRDSLLAVNRADWYVNAEDLQRWQALIEREGVVRHFEVPLRRHDGAVIWVRDNSRGIRDDDGRVLHYEGALEDITARKRMEDDLRTQRELALEAARLKSEFLATTSHELRLPLTAMIGSLQLVLVGLCDSPVEERHYLNSALASSEHLLRLINDILDFATIEAGEMTVNLAPVALREIFDEMRTLTHPEAERKGLPLTFADAGDDLRVLADPGRLRQVMLNLLNNAIKFTERGHVQVSAAVEPGESGGAGRRVRVRVRDTGIGFTPEQRARFFQKFSQADSSTTRRYGGTGLGLAISRKLVELMGGQIELESDGPDRGSCAWFTLPLADAAHPERSAAKSKGAALS